MRELEVVPGTVVLACQSKTDASLEKTGKTIEVQGNAVACELTPGLLTPIVKSGGGSAITGSVEFNGNDYLEVDLSNDAIGTDEFTIEMWVNPGETSFTATNRRLIRIGPNNNANNLQILYSVGNSNFEVDNGTNELINPGITTVATQSWSHIALTRQGTNNLKLFVNGVEDTATTTSADISQTTVQIGDDSTLSNLGLFGFISNLRIVKGTALYTDDFIPPTRELKKVPGTVLLCCQDPDNPLTEATGKTITGYGSLNQLYGTELAINGQFTADSDWTKGDQWTISGGSASITDSPNRTSDSFLTQDGSSWIHPGQMYRVAVDWSITTGDFDVRIGGDANLAKYSINSTYGSPYYFDIEAGATNTLLEIIANQHMVGSINSIHVDYAPPSKAGSNFTPQVGDDRKVTFEGVTKINSDAYFYLPTGNTITRDGGASTRGVIGGGESAINSMQYVTIASTGDALDFGDLEVGVDWPGAVGSKTRGAFAGGRTPSNVDHIQYITISSIGNSQDFGDLTVARRELSGCSDSTRGCYGGGTLGSKDEIDFITISSSGNAQDFGNLIQALDGAASYSSPTRGIWAGGEGPSPYPALNIIHYITISSKGNAQDFGDLTVSKWAVFGCSNTIRGLTAGNGNVISYINIASTGDAQDFGDLQGGTGHSGAALSSNIRGVFSAGGPSTKHMSFVNISTSGNSLDFGDALVNTYRSSGLSNGHGGLG